MISRLRRVPDASSSSGAKKSAPFGPPLLPHFALIKTHCWGCCLALITDLSICSRVVCVVADFGGVALLLACREARIRSRIMIIRPAAEW